MEGSLGERGSPDQPGAERGGVTVQRGCERGRGGLRGRGLRGAISIIQKDVGRTVAARKESSGHDPFV